MKNWAELTIDEQAAIVKTFCELHEARELTVREIAKKLDISKETAGMLAHLLHLYSGKPYPIKKKKKHYSHKRRSSNKGSSLFASFASPIMELYL